MKSQRKEKMTAADVLTRSEEKEKGVTNLPLRAKHLG